MTVTGRDRHRPNGQPTIRKGVRGGAVLLLAAALFLGGCSGNTNSSGPAAPLPTGQTGSIEATSNTGNCYVSDKNPCSSSTTGTNPITALTTLSSSGNNYLYLGDSAGNIDEATVTSTTPPTPGSCVTTGSGNKILALAANSVVMGSKVEKVLLYATSGGISSITPTSCSSSTLEPITTSITNASGLTYNAKAGEFVGVTSNAYYFTCSGNPSITCQTPQRLPSLQDASPSITAIASDPKRRLVYVLAIGASTNRIYFYYVSGTTLTYLGNYSGLELNYPSGVALFRGANPTQNFCTTGPCTFMDVTNTGNSTITQYVLTYSRSGAQTSVSVNQFNNAYFDCDLIDSAAIAAFPNYPTTNPLPTPDVFVGEQGLSTGPCMGISSGTSYGNNVTAYTVVGE
uniref:Uncharacterized protein n=1 Tax=Leptospirillum ferrodiazotrophum TaxID=412449 RepID=C6I0K9_9BACT|nr:MAG: hypothetical protein UBAL3_95680102 [Leptospirillum ferrodiazotrophum]